MNRVQQRTWEINDP